MKDRNGREYAQLSHLHPKQCIEADGGFNCLMEGQLCTVYDSSKGMFVICQEGKHYLVGQAHETRSDYLVGFYPGEVA